MTDKPTPTPTDAELKAMWQPHAADIGGIFHYARAVLAKWGTPATGGEPAGTVGYTVHGTQYVNWRTKPPAHGTPIYTTPQPTQAQAGAVPLDERAAFEAQFPVPGGVHWDGTEYVVKDSHVRSYRCNRFEGQWEAWKVRASSGQVPARATEPTEQQILEAAFAPAQPAVGASRFGSPELQAMIIARCVEKDQADRVQEDACHAPPLGWRCTRKAGHEGPCAAVEYEDEKQFVERGMQRIRDAEDAALWHWLAEYLVGTRTDLDDEIVASETVNDLRKLVEAAIKQGATQ